ncbi:MAG TPA: AEC family transporter [Stellaceae bacterium]
MFAIASTTFPVFGLILCGYLFARNGVLGRQFAEPFNRFVYFLAFPALLFVVVARTPPQKILYWPFLFAWTGSLAITFVITAVVSALLFRDRLARTAVRCMDGTCASTAFMGVPLAVAAFGKEAALQAILSTAIVVVTISVTVMLIELDYKLLSRRHDGGGAVVGTAAAITAIVREIGLSLLKNPLMVAVFAGAVLAFADVPLPMAIQRFCDLVGAAAVPVSLFAMGLFTFGQSVQQNTTEISVLTVIKLIVHPAVAWFLIVAFFPMDPVWARTTLLLAALPPASTCFVVAQRFDAYAGETSAMTLVSTVISIATISILLISIDLLLP